MGDYATPPPKPKPWWIEHPQDESLCEVCRHIDFRYMLQNRLRFTDKSANLGNLEDIVRKAEQCSFCRLIVQSICIAYDEPTDGSFPPTTINDVKALCYLNNILVYPQQPWIYRLRVKIIPVLKNRGRQEPKVMIQDLADSVEYGAEIWKGRLVGSDQFDLELLKKWLHYCETQHDTPQTSRMTTRSALNGYQRLPPSFRCIDVQRWCLTKQSSGCRYLALSYVWGPKKVFQSVKSNLSALEQGGGLATVRDQLPQTIVDSIELVAALGEKFLWVDSLCIVQDDEGNKNQQVSAMDAIYGLAVLTIVAASGAEANAGLSGYSPGSRTTIQHVEIVQGLKLVNVLPTIQAGVNQTVWDSRGWTYQERVLSQRLLFVTSKQTIFKCRHGTNFEDVVSETVRRLADTWDEDHDPEHIEHNMQINFFIYAKQVEKYTPRKHSFVTDALDAFGGVVKELEPLFRGEFLFGLPDTELDAALLWQPRGLIDRRLDPETKTPVFPSWSWVGWDGPVRHAYNVRIGQTAPRVKWIDAVSESRSFTSAEYRLPAAEGSNIGKWETSANSRIRAYYFRRDEPDLWFLHPVASHEERRPLSLIKPRSIQLRFCSLVASFSVTGQHNLASGLRGMPVCDNAKHIACPLSMFSREGYVAGTVHVPASLVKNLAWGDHDFVLLSRTSMVDAVYTDPLHPPPEDEDPVGIPPAGTSYFPKQVPVDRSPYGFDLRRYDRHKPWCLYNVMMVEWKGETATRVAIGQVHIDAFYHACPREKMIILE